MTQRRTKDGDRDKEDLDQIESEIDRTRAVISQDLREIGERLTPEHIKAEVKNEVKNVAHEAKEAAGEKIREVKDAATEKLREAKDVAVEKLTNARDVAAEKFRDVKDAASETMSHAADTVSEKYDDVRIATRHASDATVGFVRENAVPLTLLGLGAAWLIANQRSRRSRDTESWNTRSRAYGETSSRSWDRWDEDRPTIPGNGSSANGVRESANGMRETANGIRQRASGAVGDVRRELSRAGDKASEMMTHASERAHHMAERAEHAFSEGKQRARSLAEREMHRARDLAETNPLALGAAALVLGVGVGLLLPATRRENELLGPSRDRLLGGAKETVHELEQAAKDLGQTAKDTAREMKNGLSGTLGQH